MLEIDGLTVAYDQAVALRDVTMTIPTGSVVSLVGSNGAGKSTLVMSIMGLRAARAGSIRIDGEDVTHAPVSSRVGRGVALVPEGRRLFTDMSVRDNVLMGMYDQNASRRAGREALAWVHSLFPLLVSRARQKAGTLSGGEQQMVALGRALVSRPSLLILDEPSLGLAPVVVDEVFAMIETIRAEGVTILLAEQNMRRALALSDRGYVLDQGRIVLEAPASELLESDDVRRAYLGEI